MKTFRLRLCSSRRTEEIGGVVSFTGRDASGWFGIMAGACRMIAVLEFGLARLRDERGGVESLALPGGLLYFRDDVLDIAASDYERGPDEEQIVRALEKNLRAQQAAVVESRASLHRLDEEIVKRLSRRRWRLLP